MTETEKLEACPFCGGEATLYSVSFPLAADCADIHASCGTCDCIGPTVLFDNDSHGENDIADLESEAIAAWNTRPSPTAAGEPIPDNSLRRMIGELGNQIHNLGCEHQGNDALLSRLEELRSEAWRLARLATPETPSGGQPMGEVNLDELLSRYGLVLTDDPEFDHDEATFEKAKAGLIAALRSQGGEDDADAARYRWLRDNSCPPHNFYISVPDEFHGVRYSPADVDAYIDAARAALHPTEPEAVSRENGNG